MKLRTFVLLLSTALLFSCQKEVSEETPGSGTPGGGGTGGANTAAGVIMEVKVNGAYQENASITASNSLSVKVKVTRAGDYTIWSDTTAGFYFRTSGTFTDTGVKQLSIPGFGKPANSGNKNFTLKFDGSSAVFMVTVASVAGGGGGGGTGAGPAGSIAYEQELFGVIGTLREVFSYPAGGTTASIIQSQHYPDRHVFYNSANKIDKIEYWRPEPSSPTTLYRAEIYKFVYDANGNVITINEVDSNNTVLWPEMQFTYNADNTIKSKRLFWQGGSIDYFTYNYTNGNVTGIVWYDVSQTIPVDTMVITYDTRVNKFNDIHPQMYFLSIQTVFEQTYRSEMFFFSKNYPTSFSGIPVSVTTEATLQKPFEIKFNGEIWHRYGYY